MPPARPKTPIKSALKDFVIAFAVFLSFATLIWAEQASSGGTRLDVWVAAQFTTEQAITTSAGVPTPEGTAAAASAARSRLSTGMETNEKSAMRCLAPSA